MSLNRLFFITLFSLMLCRSTVSANKTELDHYYIKASIKGLPVKKIYLASVYGDEVKKIDSAVCDNGGNCQFQIASYMPVGLYRIMLGKITKADFNNGEESNIDLVFNHQNISFITLSSQLVDSLQVVESTENSVYYDFFHTIKHKYVNRLDLLSQTLRYYPQDDEFYAEVEKQFHKVLQDKEKYVHVFLEKNANTLAARIIKAQQKPDYFKFIELSGKIPEADRAEYMKAHFLDEADFTDSIILRTSLVPDKIMAFLSLYRDKQYTSVQQQEEFKKATDVLINKAKVNDAVYNYVLSYLVKGFEKIGEEEVVIYLSDKYLNNSCNNDKLKEEYSGKAEKMKKVAIGQAAPDIEMKDINGVHVKLSDINTDYSLVLFWASWCPHCQNMLPAIKNAYETINSKSKKLEVFAISIDSDSTLWKKFVAEGKYTWINCSELKGWDSKAAKDYNVYGTPTMLLLDKNKKIIGKPANAMELENEVK